VVLALPCAAAPGNPEIVFTQIPGRNPTESRLMHLSPEGSVRPLSDGFASARDPEVSFDGKRILFAGKKTPDVPWQIFEIQLDGSGLRQITHLDFDCQSPIYQSRLFNLANESPWYQIAFVGSTSGSSHLYSCKLDGSALNRLTYSLGSDVDPVMAPDGRVLFAGLRNGRAGLFGVNLDGTDYAMYSGYQGAASKRMPAVTANRQVIFVEPRIGSQNGAGDLAAVSMSRSLHSYRKLTGPAIGEFHSPSPLPNGEILVSMRSGRNRTFGICRFDPATTRSSLIYDDPASDELQARIVLPRQEPDGRGSVVDAADANGKLYCLSIYTSDLPDRAWLKPGTVKRLRVVEAVPASGQTRFLGETEIEDDGSFNVEIPANTPAQVQLLDENGMVLKSCDWIWVRNREARGCIGCHEDGELVPENRPAAALTKPSVRLTLPPERRRTVDWSRDVVPILAGKCGNQACHTPENLLKSVRAGTARTSPVVWSILGKNTTKPMPPPGSPKLTEDEKRTIIEWIDLGAHRAAGRPQ